MSSLQILFYAYTSRFCYNVTYDHARECHHELFLREEWLTLVTYGHHRAILGYNNARVTSTDCRIM